MFVSACLYGVCIVVLAAEARALADSLNAAASTCVKIADEDEAAYAALQASWKDDAMTPEDKAKVMRACLQYCR